MQIPPISSNRENTLNAKLTRWSNSDPSSVRLLPSSNHHYMDGFCACFVLSLLFISPRSWIDHRVWNAVVCWKDLHLSTIPYNIHNNYSKLVRQLFRSTLGTYVLWIYRYWILKWVVSDLYLQTEFEWRAMMMKVLSDARLLFTQWNGIWGIFRR